MKKMIIGIMMLIGAVSFSICGNLPIEYQIQKNYHRMKLMLKGDIQWNVSQSENTFDITLTGDKSKFIIKNIGYNFRDGVIKKFNYKSTSEQTKKIVVELRNGVKDFRVYQDETSKNLYIEFYPGNTAGNLLAKKMSGAKTVSSVNKLTSVPQPKNKVVNIPQLVIDQVEQPKKESDELIAVTSVPKTTSGNSSMAAMWLILVSVSILLTGGGFTAYALIRRKSSQAGVHHQQNNRTVKLPEAQTLSTYTEEPIASYSNRRMITDEESESSFPRSTEFAEQYLRSQGELDLQQRLEIMSSRSTQKKMDSALPVSKKKDPVLLAQKLGLSVGELELVTRLQKFHKQHSAEVS